MADLLEKFFGCSAEDVSKVRGFYNKSEQDVISDVKILREWLGKQAHLPQNIDDAILERMLLRNKFRIEQTKEKLDLHFTAKGYHKDYLALADPACNPIKSRMKLLNLLTFPKLTPSKERVWTLKWIGGDDNPYDFDEITLMAVMILEMQLKCDYAAAERIIFDFEGFGWTQYKTITPTSLTRVLFLLKVFSARIGGFEIVHPPSFIASVMTLLKLVFKPKLFARITIHKDFQSLHKIVPKDCLPKDYGGTLGSMVDLYDEYKQMWLSARNWMVPALRTTSTEELRIGESKYGSINVFGVDGTFKKLEVD